MTSPRSIDLQQCDCIDVGPGNMFAFKMSTTSYSNGASLREVQAGGNGGPARKTPSLIVYSEDVIIMGKTLQ